MKLKENVCRDSFAFELLLSDSKSLFAEIIFAIDAKSRFGCSVGDMSSHGLMNQLDSVSSGPLGVSTGICLCSTLPEGSVIP